MRRGDGGASMSDVPILDERSATSDNASVNVTPFPATSPQRPAVEAEEYSAETRPALQRLGERIARPFTHPAGPECVSAEQLQEFRQAAQANAVDPEVNEELSLALALAQR